MAKTSDLDSYSKDELEDELEDELDENDDDLDEDEDEDLDEDEDDEEEEEESKKVKRPYRKVQVDPICYSEQIRPVDPKLPKNYYFDNNYVEGLLAEYVKGGCIDVVLRDKIMNNAEELIKQIIRTHKLHLITNGREGSAFGDLYQIAWAQIESSLYKFDHSPGHTKVFNLWCVTPDTLLLTDQGIQTIGKCVGNDPLDWASFKTFGLGGLNDVTAYIRRLDCDTLKITTAQGYHIECTPEHKMMTLTNNGIEWKPASEMGIGCLVPIQFNQETFGDMDHIDFVPAHDKYKGWIPPDRWTEELAYFIGLIVSEGSITDRGVTICNSNSYVIEKVINNNLGLNFRKEKNKAKLVNSSTRFLEFVKYLDVGARAWNKKIPNAILKCSQDIIISFLRGMFDGDGHSGINDGNIGYTSTSKLLIDQLRVLLLNFGVITKTSCDKREKSVFCVDGRKYSSKKRLCYQLESPTYYSKVFYEKIGFGINEKQIKKKFLKTSRRMLPDIYIEFIKNLVKDSNITCYQIAKKTSNKNRKCGIWVNKIINRKTGIVYNTLIDLMEAYKSESQLNSYKFLQDRIQELDSILWLPIAKIDNSKSDTIDIEVPATRSFTANGIIVSNSQVAKTVMLAHIKKESRDKRNYGAYKEHLDNQYKPAGYKFDRFLQEAREVCKHHKGYSRVLSALEDLFDTDNRPYDGLIDKLCKRSGMSRSKISNFLRMLRLRSYEFTDSPLNEELPQGDSNKYRVMHHNYESDED